MATAQGAAFGQQLVLHDVHWDFYDRLLQLLDNRPIRLTYDRGTLEMMSPPQAHERLKRVIGRIIEEFTAALKIPMQSGGSTTWRRRDLDRGLEPDECYYLLHEPDVCLKPEIDLDVDPPPDLAIEIEVTRHALDRMRIYASLGVPEVWRFDGETLRICWLGGDGEYTERERSLNLPMLPPAEVLRFVRMGDRVREPQWVLDFRQWIAESFPPPS